MMNEIDVQVEEQELLLRNASMDSIDLEAEGIPEGFRRLDSPREGRAKPASAVRRAQALLHRLPMLYADHFDGHITDMRELLDADIWADVQACAMLTVACTFSSCFTVSRSMFPNLMIMLTKTF
jgi:hypothetical protein